MKIDFKNKVTLVTGAAEGIGYTTAKSFAKAGATVILADINATVIFYAEELAKEGYHTIGIQCDISIETEVKKMIEYIVSIYGKLDIAYNNVRIHAPVAELAEAEGADFDRVIAVNLRGIWNCMKYELIEMKKHGNGAIVNYSSQSGLIDTAGI